MCPFTDAITKRQGRLEATCLPNRVNAALRMMVKRMLPTVDAATAERVRR